MNVGVAFFENWGFDGFTTEHQSVGNLTVSPEW